jgi:hypothetical protein
MINKDILDALQKFSDFLKEEARKPSKDQERVLPYLIDMFVKQEKK